MSATTAPFSAPITAPQVALADARFIDLVTFRRTGEAIGTPVLFVLDGDHLLVRTAADTGKLKRIRHTARVQVAPSDQRGRRLGAVVEGTARILGPEAVGPTLARLHARYRIAGPLFTAVRRLRRQRDVIIAIDLPGGATDGNAEAGPRMTTPPVVASTTVPRTIGGVALTLLLAASVAACGSASAGSGQGAETGGAERVAAPTAATDPRPAVGGDGLGATLCRIVSQDDAERVLGAPVADVVATDEGMLSGASCRYATADGKGRVAVWFHSRSTRSDWIDRIAEVGMTDEEPLVGVGEAAFRSGGASARRHVKVAAFGDGHDAWIEISGAPDASTAATSAASFAQAVFTAFE